MGGTSSSGTSGRAGTTPVARPLTRPVFQNTAAALKAIMDDHGVVMVGFTANDSLFLVTSIHHSLSIADARGLPRPADIYRENRPRSNSNASFDPNNGHVTVNVARMDPGSLASNARTGWSTSTNQEEVMLHEFAHYAHFEAVKSGGRGPYGPWATMRGSKAAGSASVSQYAMTNQLEFVAETYVGMYRGQSYSPSITATYQSLKGPVLK